MPVPKRRHSHSRTRKRRANWKIDPLNYGECPKCHAPRLPHRVCPSCGYYDNVLVYKKKEKKERK